MDFLKSADRLAWRFFFAFVLILMVSAANADGLYLELGAGYDKNISAGHNPQSVIRIRYELDERPWWVPTVYEWNHHSSFQDGPPFNHNREDTVDQISIIWRFKFL